MYFVKYLALSLICALFAANAFAEVDLTVGDGEHAMSYCGGTVEVNSGGNGNQLNIVFHRVVNCSNIDFNGRHYELKGAQGSRGGNFTVLLADDRRSGEHTQYVRLSSDSGAHYEDVFVHYQILYR